MPRPALLAELLTLFIALPLAFRFSPIHLPALPLLWAVSAYALWQLFRTPAFPRAQLWRAPALAPHLAAVLGIFVLGAFTLWLGVHRFAPQLEWGLPRTSPVFWATVMFIYPVFSVYPQNILYRAFFFERYAPLFPSRWAMILASAFAFAFLHIIFRNALAVGLTFLGGLLFAARYAQTRSLAASSFEHALYGCWLFTVGLGPFFYHGTIQSVGSALTR